MTTTTTPKTPATTIVAPNATTDDDNDGTTITTESIRSQFQEVMAYFITTSTTIDPPINTTMAAAPIIDTEKIPVIDETTTPYSPNFLDILNESGTSIYDINDLNEDDFEDCIRTICEDDFGTTEMEVTSTKAPKLTTTTQIALTSTVLTPLEDYQRRLIQVKHNLSIVEHDLETMCWETSLGQELSKVVVFDGVSLNG